VALGTLLVLLGIWLLARQLPAAARNDAGAPPAPVSAGA
jgi:hypothetical protein